MIRSLIAFQIANALEATMTEMVSGALRMRDCEILFGVRIMPE